MNKIAIRVDANEIVATGHIMRCRTIAGSLSQMGCSVVFVSADDNIIPYVGEDYQVQVLHTNWRNLQDEVDTFVDFLQFEGINRILVDSYYATPEYIKALRDCGMRVMYIDDMKKETYPANAILNYSPGARYLGYEEFYGDEQPMLLLGTKYIPLREQFWQKNDDFESARGVVLGTDGEALKNIDIIAKENAEAFMGVHRTYGYEKDGVESIFLTTGGADSMGLSEIISTALIRDPELGFKTDRNKKIHLLAGRFYRVTEKIQEYIEDGYVVLHQNVSNVADIMKMCDVAITPAGTTLFELSALGIPSVSFVFAENQEPDALYFSEKKLVPYAGDFREDDAEVLRNIIFAIKDFAKLDSADRIEHGEKLKELIDGQGADRIAEALLEM
ncbi:MAG: hypothetical protein K6G06_09340 [Butyrivibrio sp.]|nr:hypothetical protein [Butyrivibrio sp.]